jgi:non-canonical purine NTP pyrophosphatase (RdgB/HAM1 family)
MAALAIRNVPLKSPLFVTGNQHKADHLSRLLELPLEHIKLDLDEIQSANLEEVATHKVKQAYGLVKRPVFVEDVALGFDALDGLPGPFIKFFLTAEGGLENLCRMLDGFSSRRAYGECVFAYYDGKKLELFRGGIAGIVPEHPQGKDGFGWDPIFCPDGYDGRTRAELTEQEYAVVYQVIKPIAALRAFLLEE